MTEVYSLQLLRLKIQDKNVWLLVSVLLCAHMEEGAREVSQTSFAGY
jgi:hypothetical protein